MARGARFTSASPANFLRNHHLMLTPHLRRSPDGELLCENVRLTDVARQFGTPAYVYSRATIVDNFRAYQRAFAASAL